MRKHIWCVNCSMKIYIWCARPDCIWFVHLSNKESGDFYDETNMKKYIRMINTMEVCMTYDCKHRYWEMIIEERNIVWCFMMHMVHAVRNKGNR
jgi:hypothetical protein